SLPGPGRLRHGVTLVADAAVWRDRRRARRPLRLSASGAVGHDSVHGLLARLGNTVRHRRARGLALRRHPHRARPRKRALGAAGAGLLYGRRLAADAGGALTAVILREGSGLLPPRPRPAFVLGMVWCAALAGFAMTRSYVIAVLLQFAAGFFQLSYNSMTQTLV